ncbi:MAG: BatD family protein [Sandaracinaceae bacterium]
MSLRRTRRSVLALALLATLGALAPAQVLAQQVSASVSMTADRTRVAVGERFTLTVEARCQGAADPQVEFPELDGFDVLGRRGSTPFSLRFGFGAGQQVQSTVRHTLTLEARRAGRFELEPATVILAGQRFRSAGLTIEVTDRAGSVPSSPNDPNAAPTQMPGQTSLPPSTDLADGMQFDPSGFLRTWIDPGNPYVGQQATIGVYLYLPQPLSGNPQITQEPTTDGFWVQDLLPPSRSLEAQRQEVNGRTFYVYLLRRLAAFPLSEGDLTIGPTQITVEATSLFDVFGMGNRTAEPWVRTGVPLTLHVRPLPDLPHAQGPVHVGALSIRAELDRSQIATGDAVTLTITANGTGAMAQLRIPDPEMDGLRVLAPEIRDQITTRNDVVSGVRTFRWLIVPERAGDFTLGPFDVPVLDPIRGAYSVAHADALTLTAAGRNPDEVSASPAPTPVEGDDEERARFGPVRTESALAHSRAVLSEQPWFLASLGLGPVSLLFALGLLFVRKRAASSDPKDAPRRARKLAKQRLAAAEEHLKAGAAADFYAAIASALKETVEAQLGRAVGSFTHAELGRTLSERGMEPELRERLIDELEGCDFARFSAVGVSSTEMNECLRRAQRLTVELGRFTPTEEEP